MVPLGILDLITTLNLLKPRCSPVFNLSLSIVVFLPLAISSYFVPPFTVSVFQLFFLDTDLLCNMVSVPATYGAILLGGFLAAALSGIVTVQSFIYIKLYPTDLAWRKAIVAVIWILDSIHTALVCASIWIYLIKNFGDTSKINDIPETVAMTIALTAILTFIVHCFFAHRIHKLSHCDWRITAPLVSLVLLKSDEG
ncbi:hypothetical protein EDB19DRAFT_1006902 [Suillus lakei]|nr:hypothetical protein EDB19DRAFT_1006902 [Suillus lakei]